jgi:hypothetical protein
MSYMLCPTRYVLLTSEQAIAQKPVLLPVLVINNLRERDVYLGFVREMTNSIA